MKIPITRSSMPLFDEYCAEIRDLWDTRWLTNTGAKHRELQAALCDYLSVPHIELLTNGHIALELAIHALDLHGEIITTPFTFASTTQAIVRCGCTPVFCDIDSVTYCLDPAKIEPLITEKTCAILPVHVYGNVCDTSAIQRIANKHNLKVTYDAAHCFGVRLNNVGIGNFGDVSCFSFHATKVFHTVEGGAICYHDSAIGERLAKLKNFGIGADGDVEEIGLNAKMNEFCAAMGLCNLRHIDAEIAKRGAAVKRYRERLSDVSGLRLAAEQERVKPNYAYFPVVFDEKRFGVSRDEIHETLAKNGITARKYFYPLTSRFPCYNGKFNAAKTPIAEWISDRVLTLPLYADLSLTEVDRICDLIIKCSN